MRKFESSQKDESRAQLADSSKAYRKRRAFYCFFMRLEKVEFGTLRSSHLHLNELRCWIVATY